MAHREAPGRTLIGALGSVVVLALVVGIGLLQRGDLLGHAPQRLRRDPQAMRGYWEAAAGDINISEEAVGQIYNYDWFAIEPLSPIQVQVMWDNGQSCSRTEGNVTGQTVRLLEHGVVTTFVFHDQDAATVTFHHGLDTWVKELKKRRDDPTVRCY